MMRYWLPLFALMAAPALALPKAETVAAYQAISALDAKLATVGHRLSTANASFCANNLGFNPGWVLHDIAQYPDAEAAKAAFGFAQPVEVAFVVPGGEAENQGIKAGDGLLRIGNRDAASIKTESGTSALRLEAIRLFLDQTWGPNFLAPMRVRRGAETREILFQLNPVCASHFWVEAKGTRDAGADGEKVRITSAMIEYTENEGQLAAIAAHELAHNLLRHPAQLRATKKAKSKLVVATELEADRLSAWLLINAGYDPRDAVKFWQRCGPASCLGPMRYPSWKKRIEALNAEIVLVTQSTAQNGLRTPPLLSPVRKTE